MNPRPAAIVCLLLASIHARAQAQTPPPAPPVEVSGVLYLTFQSGGTKAQRLAAQNRFDLERAYINLRGAAGDRMSVRATADIFQQRDSTRDGFYSGWAFRAKYAYAQYDYLRGGADAWRAVARFGMIPTVVIDVEENFWLRGVASTAVEQTGFFSSADLGASTVVSLPGRRGEAFFGVLNGAGYATRETDRFKDVAARLTLTPLASGNSPIRSLSITPWAVKGARASDFARGRGTVSPVWEGRQKDRFGLHLGVRDPKLTVGAQLAWRMDGSESADTLVDVRPSVDRRVGRTISTYFVAKPLDLAGITSAPLKVLLRVDDVRTDLDRPNGSRQVIGGTGYDLNSRAQLWLDFQNQDAKGGAAGPDVKTLFVRGIVNY